MMKQLESDFEKIMMEFMNKLDLNKTEAVVLGCSSSMIINKKIGTASDKQVGEVVVSMMKKMLARHDIQLVVQGCQHINRSLVVEREYALKHNLEQVNVIPILHAGGAVATAAYNIFNDPVVVSSVKVDAGLDIGQTLIGMHLKEVVIPIHLENNYLGSAIVLGATTRLKLIGGERAVYQEDLL